MQKIWSYQTKRVYLQHKLNLSTFMAIRFTIAKRGLLPIEKTENGRTGSQESLENGTAGSQKTLEDGAEGSQESQENGTVTLADAALRASRP